MPPQICQNSVTLDSCRLDSQICSPDVNKSRGGGDQKAQLTSLLPLPSTSTTNSSVSLKEDRRELIFNDATKNDTSNNNQVEDDYYEDDYYEDDYYEDDYYEDDYYEDDYYEDDYYEDDYYEEGYREEMDIMKRVPPSDPRFERILKRHQILMPPSGVCGGYRPRNLDADCERLRQPRPAAEPIPHTTDDFNRFTKKLGQLTEAGAMLNAFLTIRGLEAQTSAYNLPCINFTNMTSNQATPPKPDYLEGASEDDVHPVLVHELESLILPTDRGLSDMLLIAPNLALEAKSSAGCLLTAQRQACLDGAYGARALRALDLWGRGDNYDDKEAYAYSATYHDNRGLLELYSHSVEVLADGAQRYHMIRLDTIVLSSDIKELYRGVVAFRNLRDMAAERRDTIIQAANARAASAGGDM